MLSDNTFPIKYLNEVFTPIFPLLNLHCNIITVLSSQFNYEKFQIIALIIKILAYHNLIIILASVGNGK